VSRRRNEPKGAIVLIGGAEDKEGAANVLRRFIEVSGGKASRIAVSYTL
jgi:cyanophycinase-like exopeptidase